MHSYSLILFLVVQVTFLSGQQPFMKQFTDEEGLSSMTIYTITQDHQGFIWIGTDNGLCKYNGKEFKVFTHPKAMDNEFIGVYCDPSNRVWTWNLSGEIYRVDDGKLVRYLPETLSGDLIFDSVIGDEEGNVYLAHTNWKHHFYYICNANDSCYQQPVISDYLSFIPFLTNIKQQNTKKHINVRHTRFSNAFKDTKEYEILLERGLSDDSRFDYLATQTEKVLGINRTSKRIFQLKKSQRGSFGVEDITLVPESVHLRLGYIRIFYQDKEGYYWLGDDKHLYQFDENFHLIQDVSVILENMTLNYFFQDQEGGYWIGSNTNGLFYIPSFEVKTYSNRDLPLKGSQIISIESLNDDEIVIATQQGDIFRMKNHRVIDYKYYGSSINSFQKSMKDGFWMGDKNHLLYLNSQLEIERSYRAGTTIKDIVESDKKLYVATALALLTMPKNVKLIRHSEKKLIKKRTNSLLKTTNNRLWAGTVDGLYIITDEEVRIFKNAVNQDTFKYWITEMIEEASRSIWVATKNNGIFNIKNDSIKYHLTTADGLNSNQCESLFYDKKGNLWIGTLNGLNILNTASLTFKKINRANGLPSGKVNDIFVRDEDVWVTTPKGLSYFKANIVPDTIALPIILSRIKINGLQRELINNHTLSPKENNLNFEFISPSYKYQGDILYSYRMVGLDNEWKFTKDNTIQYDRLRSGNYQFKVRACIHEGDKSGVVTGVNIRIRKSIYNQVWFYVVLLLSLGAVGSGIFMIWLRFYEKRQEKEAYFNRQFSELKISALQSQMNPHFIFNALNAIQNFFLTNEREAALMYLAKFARLIRLIFEYSKLSTITLDQELKFLKLYLQLEKLRFGEKIDIQLEGDEIPDKEYILLPPLLIQPVIENALKHGLLHKEKDGKLTVKFERIGEKMLRVLVLDNGIGRVQAKKYNEWKPKEYKSSGVQTIEERVRLINHEAGKIEVQFYIRDLADEYKQATGTKVEFIFKIKKMINEYDDE